MEGEDDDEEENEENENEDGGNEDDEDVEDEEVEEGEVDADLRDRVKAALGGAAVPSDAEVEYICYVCTCVPSLIFSHIYCIKYKLFQAAHETLFNLLRELLLTHVI